MTDRFDAAPRMGRVGVHRAPERTWWKWWMTLIVAGAACIVLVVGGLGALQLMQVGGVDTSIPTGPEPVTDPAALPEGTSITVLDASGADAADAVAATLQSGGWPVAAVADASETRATTTVYFQGAELEGAALGIAQAIGVSATEATDQALSGSTITIIVGSGAEPEPSATP